MLKVQGAIAALLLYMVDTMTLSVLLFFPLETETSGYLIKNKMLYNKQDIKFGLVWFTVLLLPLC